MSATIVLLDNPAACSCWISWTWPAALSGQWRRPLGLRSASSRSWPTGHAGGEAA
ncbi:hypothetical protein [[Kitasatospora] papulosa]|uniref:hypothetical protein n=1 Tax=[Kitasatospora] papulosa TaxID=1464011 RepID=UPI003679D33B